jgi:carbonic anhydrase
LTDVDFSTRSEAASPPADSPSAWEPSITADEALARLVAGNERFLRGEARFQTMQKEVLAKLAGGQQPFATILGCSDSRVPPELVFDAGFGELFVIRIAGNVICAEVLGSLHYAAFHLHTPLFIVLGHANCGAVKAALARKWHGSHEPPRITELVEHIMPALEDIDPESAPRVQLQAAVEANVRWSIRQLAETPEAQARVAEGVIKIVGAIYELDSGSVRFLA